MSKRNIIFICIAVAVIIVIAFIVFFVTRNTKANSITKIEKITLIKYDDNFEVEKNIEITSKKEIKEIKNICNNPSLEQDDTSKYLAIRNDAKLDLENGEQFIIQLNLPEYCYYENSEKEIKLVIKMPQGLLEKIESILNENA